MTVGSSQTQHAWVKLQYGRQSISLFKTLKTQIFTWKSSVDWNHFRGTRFQNKWVTLPNRYIWFFFFFVGHLFLKSSFLFRFTISNSFLLYSYSFKQEDPTFHHLLTNTCTDYTISRVMWKNNGVNHSNLEKIGSSHSVLWPKDTAARGTPRVTRQWWPSLVLPLFWISLCFELASRAS